MSIAADCAVMKKAVRMPDGQERCLDLANAYKQFAVNPADKRSSAIVVVKDEGLEVYYSLVLPFGATASVYGFLRVSDVLKRVLTDVLGLMLTSYYDDFPSVCYAGLADVSQFGAEQLLGQLGI
eukprot:6391903-Amphidinium_carterae.1